MSLAELKKESAALSAKEQQELAAFLAKLRMQQSGEWQDVTDAKTGKDGWISLEEAKRRLSQED